MATKNWTCPFCNRPQTLTDGQLKVRNTWLGLAEHKYGNAGLQAVAYACANPECQEITLSLNFGGGSGTWDNFRLQSVFETYHVRPQGSVKPQPDYIPRAIREDYIEACRIRDLSPKASAALSRRCLQGMIRDFCGISKSRLIDEIRELRSQLDAGTQPRGVTHESVEAIDKVRSVGNIGAHMERDVNLIVDIEPDEAQLLIDLIEMLFDEWYVERDKRAKRLAEISALSERKTEELERARQALLTANQPPQLLSPLSSLALDDSEGGS